MAEITKDEEYYTLLDTLDKGISDYSCSDFIDKAENLFPKMEQIINKLNGGLSNFWEDQVKDKTEEQSGGQLTEILLNTKSYVDDVIKQLGPNVEDLKGKLENYKNCYEQYLEANTTLNELKKNAPENPNEEDYSSLAVYSEAYQYFCDYQVTISKQETKRNNYAENTNAAHSECETLISSINKLLDYTNNETASDLESTTTTASTNISSTETTIDENGNTHVVTTMTNEDGTISTYEEVTTEYGKVVATYKTDYYENGNPKSYESFEEYGLIEENKKVKNLKKTITYYKNGEEHEIETSYDDYYHSEPRHFCKNNIYDDNGVLIELSEEIGENDSDTKDYSRYYSASKKQEIIKYGRYDPSFRERDFIDDSENDFDEISHFENLTIVYDFADEDVSDSKYIEFENADGSINKKSVRKETITFDKGYHVNNHDKSETKYYYSEEEYDNYKVEKTYYAGDAITSVISFDKYIDEDGTVVKTNSKSEVIVNNNSDINKKVVQIKEYYDVENEDGTVENIYSEKLNGSDYEREKIYIEGVEREFHYRNVERMDGSEKYEGCIGTKVKEYSHSYYDEEGNLDYKVYSDKAVEDQGAKKCTTYYENNLPTKDVYTVSDSRTKQINYEGGQAVSEEMHYTSSDLNEIETLDYRTGFTTKKRDYANGASYEETSIDSVDPAAKKYAFTDTNADGKTITGTRFEKNGFTYRASTIDEKTTETSTSTTKHYSGDLIGVEEKITIENNNATGETVKTTTRSFNDKETTLIENRDSNGKVTSSIETTEKNGNTEKVTYNYKYEGDRLIEKSGTLYNERGTIPIKTTYQYNKQGNISKQIEETDLPGIDYDTVTTEYKYDDNNRLISSEQVDYRVNDFSTGRKTVGNTTYIYDDSDKLIGEHTDYKEYDGRLWGLVLRDEESYSSNSNYIYDGEDLLAKETKIEKGEKVYHKEEIYNDNGDRIFK